MRIHLAFVGIGRGNRKLDRGLDLRAHRRFDAFQNLRGDAVLGKQFAEQLGADKVLVQKSGYFARSAAANDADLELIRDCTRYAVDAALRGASLPLAAGLQGEQELFALVSSTADMREGLTAFLEKRTAQFRNR